jgi:hypothetical protein
VPDLELATLMFRGEANNKGSNLGSGTLRAHMRLEFSGRARVNLACTLLEIALSSTWVRTYVELAKLGLHAAMGAGVEHARREHLGHSIDYAQ